MKKALKGIFKKAEFYSFIKIDGKATPVKQQGYTDGKYHYYNNNNSGIWYAIDYYTGLSICDGITLEECYQSVHSEHFQKLLEEAKNSERYDEQCSKWYQALVTAGIIQETTF